MGFVCSSVKWDHSTCAYCRAGGEKETHRRYPLCLQVPRSINKEITVPPGTSWWGGGPSGQYAEEVVCECAPGLALGWEKEEKQDFPLLPPRDAGLLYSVNAECQTFLRCKMSQAERPGKETTNSIFTSRVYHHVGLPRGRQRDMERLRAMWRVLGGY